MFKSKVAIWKKSPFLRLLIPLMTGILIQWQFQFPVRLAWHFFSGSILLLIAGFLFPAFTKFRLNLLDGVAVIFIFLSLGSLLACYKDTRQQSSWFGTY